MDSVDIAGAFVTARREATALTDYPGPLPNDLDQAYRIQEAAIGLSEDAGRRIAGWKAGLIAPDLRVPGGDERLVGPIWADTVRSVSGDSTSPELVEGPTMPVYEHGFAAAEAEFVVRLEVDVVPGTWDADDAAALPHTVLAGIEIASSPLVAINDLGPAVTASDFGNNHGLIVGDPIPVGSDELAGVEVRTEIDGAVVGEATGAAIPGGIHTSLAQTLPILGRRGRTVAAGSLIATGAVTGVHRARVGQRVAVTFAGVPVLRCRLGAQQ